MSRRKQNKPQALRTKEDEEMELGVGAKVESSSKVENGETLRRCDSEDNSGASETCESDNVELEPQDVSTLTDESRRGLGGIACYTCTYCPLAFEKFTQLQLHEQEHADLMPYRCSSCGKGFKHKRSQDRHQKLHSGVRKYKCHLCETAFFRSDHLKLHLKTHETSKYPFICVTCQRGFNSSASLEAHNLTHTSKNGDGSNQAEWGKVFDADAIVAATSLTQCSVCSLRLNSLEDLMAHLDSEHQALGIETSRIDSPSSNTPHRASTTCPFCKKGEFACDDDFQLHLEVVHGAAPLAVDVDEPVNGTPSIKSDGSRITCGLCPDTFADVGLLQKHTLHRHSLRDLSQNNFVDEDPTYACDECGRVFDSILALHSHANSVHAGSSSDVIRRSLQLQTQRRRSPQMYQCGQCDTGLQNLKAFTLHMRQHLDVSAKERQLHCDFCGLSFNKESTRDAHLITHYLQKESQFSCQSCNKTFPIPDELQKHLIDIHALHLYRCALCKDIFESRVDMQVHFAVSHSNEIVRYRCRSCNAAFPSEDQFNVHLQVVHLQRAVVLTSPSSATHSSFHGSSFKNAAAAFSCSLCGESFAVEYLYEKHVENMHSGRLNCFSNSFFDFGGKKTVNSAATSQVAPSSVVAASRVAVVVKCNICDEKCDTVVDLARHKLQHCKVIYSEVCNVCQEPIGSVDEFYAHSRQHAEHGVPNACIVCKQSMASMVEMQAHAKFHLKVDADGDDETKSNSTCLKCAPCNVKFEDDVELRRHCKEQHPTTTTTKSYQCIKCQKSFSTEAEIHAHVASHVMQDGVNHPCRLCKTTFDSPSKLQRHLIEHSFEGCAEYKCYLCELLFASAQPLQQHMIVRHANDERPYECDLCGEQKFFFRAELDNHTLSAHEVSTKNGDQLMQLEAETFACKQCGVAFNSAGTLKSHSAQCRRRNDINDVGSSFSVHATSTSGESRNGEFTPTDATHQCPHCPKVFRSLSALQGHSHVHMTSRVHQCSKCRKTFQTAAKLRNHQRQHNGDKPFPCEFCGRFFSRKDNLKVHMRIHFKNGSASPGSTSMTTDQPPTMVSGSQDFGKRSLDFADFNFDVSDDCSNNSMGMKESGRSSECLYSLRSRDESTLEAESLEA